MRQVRSAWTALRDGVGPVLASTGRRGRREQMLVLHEDQAPLYVARSRPYVTFLFSSLLSFDNAL